MENSHPVSRVRIYFLLFSCLICFWIFQLKIPRVFLCNISESVKPVLDRHTETIFVSHPSFCLPVAFAGFACWRMDESEVVWICCLFFIHGKAYYHGF